jgi:hypothetical protein
MELTRNIFYDDSVPVTHALTQQKNKTRRIAALLASTCLLVGSVSALQLSREGETNSCAQETRLECHCGSDCSCGGSCVCGCGCGCGSG